MEKYSQFRDRGSGISPFIPSTTPTSTLSLLWHSAIFAFRLPFFLFFAVTGFLALDFLPLPVVVRKLLLWTILGIPGIWWVDLQLDGVKRGSLSQQPASRFPRDRSVIASQFTSPIDALYLAAIFDPIFVASYPGEERVRRLSLFGAVMMALAPPTLCPASTSGLTTLRALIEANPHRVVAVFPECSTTNGKGILPFSPSLLTAPSDAQTFPVSMRYTPADIATPVPGAYFSFLWNLLSKPTHYIRVRIGEGVQNTSRLTNGVHHVFDETDKDEGDDHLTPDERHFLNQIAETLARLARNKRVGLTLDDKLAFVEAWGNKK
ncbi:hypothetical protein F5Y15DRAFT_384731 [Xylariaceae sp. FL0016]|nr:hypothetical protein F5Y15DRAFT_384731 [Xylariaceae sp. FL0016]